MPLSTTEKNNIITNIGRELNIDLIEISSRVPKPIVFADHLLWDNRIVSKVNIEDIGHRRDREGNGEEEGDGGREEEGEERGYREDVDYGKCRWLYFICQ